MQRAQAENLFFNQIQAAMASVCRHISLRGNAMSVDGTGSAVYWNLGANGKLAPKGAYITPTPSYSAGVLKGIGGVSPSGLPGRCRAAH